MTLAAQLAIPAKYGWREYVVAGGLMSYGTNLPDPIVAPVSMSGAFSRARSRRVAVMEPDKFELVLNAKTAKALGIEIPLCLSGPTR